MAESLYELVLAHGVELKQKGEEFFGLCPFHTEKTPSFSVHPGKNAFYCFGCGAEGGISKWLELTGQPKRTRKSTPQQKKNRLIKSLPKTADAVYHYRDESGKLKYSLCKFSDIGAKAIPYTWLADKECYKLGQHTECILYRRQAITKPNLVIIVEGEKCADAFAGLAENVLKAPVTTWTGGGNRVLKTDWSPLKGKKCILWADSDPPGVKAMQLLADRLVLKHDCSVRIACKEFEGDGDGWDVADAIAEGWSRAQVLNWLKVNAKSYTPGEVETLSMIHDNDHYRILGRGESVIWFRIKKTQEIKFKAVRDINTKFLIEIAPLEWWLGLGGERRATNINGPMLQSFYDAIIRCAQSLQRLNILSLKGLGAALDNKRYVFHLGNKVLIENEPCKLDDPRLSYQYSEQMPLLLAKNLAGEDLIRRFVEAVMGYKWISQMNGRMFIGWLFSSLIGGALEWRPNLWILAPWGAGKSWIADHIIAPFFSEYCHVLSKSTTASISRLISNNALPLIVDEAEPERDGVILQTLACFRSASSGTGKHTKASMTEGEVVSTEPRASLLFSSTVLPTMNAATRSRFMVLKLDPLHVDENEFIDMTAPIDAFR